MWSGRRTVSAAAAVAIAAGAPVVAHASAGEGHAAKRAAAGVVYGGVTPQNWPVVIQVSRDHREVVRSAMGFRLACTLDQTEFGSDIYVHVPIHANRRFKDSYSGISDDNPDGTYYVLSGSLRGRVNRAHTKISGSSRFAYTLNDANGAVKNSCDSGVVRFKAKQ